MRQEASSDSVQRANREIFEEEHYKNMAQLKVSVDFE